MSLPARRVHPDLPDGQPGCNPEMLSHIIIADDDDEYYNEEGDEDYDEEEGNEEEYDEEYDDEEEEGDEEYDEGRLVEPADILVSADPFAGQEMETIEQKLSRDPHWKKIKAKLNNI